MLAEVCVIAGRVVVVVGGARVAAVAVVVDGAGA
jgi:hypothetical protein